MVETPWTTRYHECRTYHSSYILSYLPGSCFSVSFVSISSQPHQRPSKKKTPTPLSQILSVDFRQRGKAIQERKELSRLHGVGRIVQPTRLHKRSIPTSMHTHRIPRSSLASSAAKNSLWRIYVSGKRWIGLDFFVVDVGLL